jgi:hypothetical protein
MRRGKNPLTGNFQVLLGMVELFNNYISSAVITLSQSRIKVKVQSAKEYIEPPT